MGRKAIFKGSCAHAPATLVYDISYLVDDYGYDTFTGYLGVDYSKGSNGTDVNIQTYIHLKTIALGHRLKTPVC